MEGPAGEPVIELVLEGSNLTAIARCNGKNYRKMLKTIAEQGADAVAVVLQGVLRPPADLGGPYLLEGAGFQVNLKTPRPAPQPGQLPQGDQVLVGLHRGGQLLLPQELGDPAGV